VNASVIGTPTVEFQLRSTQRRTRSLWQDEAPLTEAIVGLAAEYGRYGYRRITAMLRARGWHVNAKRRTRRNMGQLSHNPWIPVPGQASTTSHPDESGPSRSGPFPSPDHRPAQTSAA